jgi:hypothetical protein
VLAMYICLFGHLFVLFFPFLERWSTSYSVVIQISFLFNLQAIVTNHLVLRGTYRSLTLVIYGNTAEDLGQFNIELGLDHSLMNVVSSPSEGKLEDLPPALNSSTLSFEESLSSLKPLTFQATELDLSTEVKKILYLTLKMYQMFDVENLIPNLRGTVTSAISKYVRASTNHIIHTWDKDMDNAIIKSNSDPQAVTKILIEAGNELFEIWKNINAVADKNIFNDGCFDIGMDEELPTTKNLVELFNKCFPHYQDVSLHDLQHPSQVLYVTLLKNLHAKATIFTLCQFSFQNKLLVLSLSLVLLLCSSRESCFYFVCAGGMEQIINLLCWKTPKSAATTLLILSIVEHATRHGFGCEAFLGWWPRSDHKNIPICSSDGYCSLLKLLLEKERRDIASLSTYVLQRLRFFEILSKYEV